MYVWVCVGVSVRVRVFGNYFRKITLGADVGFSIQVCMEFLWNAEVILADSRVMLSLERSVALSQSPVSISCNSDQPSLLSDLGPWVQCQV